MKKVHTRDLVPGMITAEDVFNYNDSLLLPKGSVLTDDLITRLEFYSIVGVAISDDTSCLSPGEPEPSTYSERIRQSVEFIIFKKHFYENLDTLKNVMNDVASRHLAIDTASMLSWAGQIVPDDMTSLRVFDMLQNLRDEDDSTFIHSLNVALIANIFGKWLGYPQEEIETLTLCGLLHDIGKLKIPPQIIKKPVKLTDLEYEIVKTHTLEGFNLLKDQDVSERIKKSALMHHERCDKSGYPSGLNAACIDDYAKIIAIADVYDAMTSQRVYRGPLCPFKVISIFEEDGFQKYAPQFLLPFLERIVETYMNHTVLLSDGTEGEIVMINRNALSKPMIKSGDRYISLADVHGLTIEALL